MAEQQPNISAILAALGMLHLMKGFQ